MREDKVNTDVPIGFGLDRLNICKEPLAIMVMKAVDTRPKLNGLQTFVNPTALLEFTVSGNYATFNVVYTTCEKQS